MPRRCHDCGSLSAETAFPGPRKLSLRRDRCCDCAAEAGLEPAGPSARPVQTRASYRAAFRHRATLAQGDLVDLLVPPP